MQLPVPVAKGGFVECTGPSSSINPINDARYVFEMCDEQDGEDDPDVIEWIKENRKDKVSYDATRRFQETWAAKLNWAECVKGGNGLYDFVRCIVCTEFETREKILQPKWDTLKKHGGKRKAKKTIPSKGIRIGQW
jgi:hypothetical protein